MNFAKFLGKPFPQNTSGRLLLKIKLLFIHNSEKTTPIYFQIVDYEIPEAVVRRCSVKKMFLKISQNFQENICARVSFLIKLRGLRAATLLKKKLWHKCFPMNFAKYLRTPFFTEHFRWLLLKYEKPL